jgi:hypothetical protein
LRSNLRLMFLRKRKLNRLLLRSLPRKSLKLLNL